MLRTWGAYFFIMAFCILISGCFRPLYGPILSANKNVQESLRAVAIHVSAPQETSDFLKHEFRNALRFSLTGGQETVGPKTHGLAIRLTHTVMPALFDIKQGIATNILLTATAEFKLESFDGKVAPFMGRAITSVIMNQNPQGFANLREERDAYIRVAHTLVDQIYSRLAMYFSKGHVPVLADR